ncbi:MAG: DMT family transporter [Alistipes sp.]
MKKGILYALLASILWAVVNPLIKQGLSYDFTPMNFAGLRFITVGVILMAYTWHRGMWQEIVAQRRLFGNLILINMFMGYSAFYFGVDFVSGAIGSIVMGLTPLINVLLAHLLASNDRLNRYKIISLIVSFAGLLLIVGVGGNGAPLDWRAIGGIGLLLLSIIFQGYSAISVSEERSHVDPIFLNAIQMFFGGLLLYGVGLMTEGFHPFWGKPTGFYVSLGVLVFISTFAFSLWFMALRSENTKVSDINMCRLVNPILGAVLSWIMLAGESPTFGTVTGMVIIVSSLVIYFKGEELTRRFRTPAATKSKK